MTENKSKTRMQKKANEQKLFLIICFLAFLIVGIGMTFACIR